MNFCLLALLCIATVSPIFEYRGRIPGSVLDLKNAEPFVIDLTNRLSVLEQREPPAVTGIVRKVNGQSPDTNGWVNVDVGVLTVNNTPPDTNGNVNISSGSVDSMAFTNAMFVMQRSIDRPKTQNLYFIDITGLNNYDLHPPTNRIQGISGRFTIVLKTDRKTQINFIGFDDDSFLVPRNWNGYVQAGYNEFCFSEYSSGAYLVRQNYKVESRSRDLDTPLYFVAAEPNVEISMWRGNPVPKLETSRDLINWNSFLPGTTTVILTNVGERVYFRAQSEGNIQLGESTFELSKKAYCHGNIQYLLSQTPDNSVGAYAFYSLFAYCDDKLLSCPLLPATQLAEECYSDMFYGCTGIIMPPELPAQTLAQSCYDGMFSGCKSLVSAPDLLALDIPFGAYQSMFNRCDQLKNAPIISAKRISSYGCAYMFQGSGVRTSPTFELDSLGTYAMAGMFAMCTNLVQADDIMCNQGGERCCYRMFMGCPKLARAGVIKLGTYDMYSCAEMFRDCESLEIGPNILDENIGSSNFSYASAFKNCGSLKTLRVNFSDFGDNCTLSWLEGASRTGTFYCPTALPITVRNDWTVPEEWEIVRED